MFAHANMTFSNVAVRNSVVHHNGVVYFVRNYSKLNSQFRGIKNRCNKDSRVVVEEGGRAKYKFTDIDQFASYLFLE